MLQIYPERQAGSHLPADSANPVLRSPFVNGECEISPVQDNPIATIPSLKRSVAPGAASLQAAPSLELPLTSLPKYHTESDSLSSSSPEHRRPASSVYYTTTWGSPYATPSPKRYPSSFRSRRHREEEEGEGVEERAGVYNSWESSPLSTRSINPKASRASSRISLKPSARFSRRFYGSTGKSPGRGRQGNPTKDFTEEWINQYLSGQLQTERTNWLSDDSADSGTGSFLTARNHLSEDQSEGWLGLEDDSQDEDHLQTPTSHTFGKGKSRDLHRDGGLPSRPPRMWSKHMPKKSTDTLKQSDFWDFGYDPDAVHTSAIMSDKDAPRGLSPHTGSSSVGDSSLPISPIDKPLPPPPPANEQNDGVSQSPSVSPLLPLKQTRISTPVFQRPKKRVQWGKKQCIIAMPLEDNRGSGSGPGSFPLLTPAGVAERLKMWEEEGYDTRGYEENLFIGGGGGGEAVSGSQSRPAYPDPNDCQSEWRENKYNISFPDQSEWDAYVNFLKEEKLRALGVFLDPEPPASAISQGSAQLSQTSSHQFPSHPFSPPIPTSSAGSNQFCLPTHPLSAPFSQPPLAASTPGAFVSPVASPFRVPSSSSFPNQPGLIGMDRSFNQGFPFLPFQPTPPAQSSFASPNFLVGRPGSAVSPVSSAALANLSMNSMLAPVSPLHSDDAKQFPGKMNLLSQLQGLLPIQSQQQQQPLQQPLQLQPQLQQEEDSSQFIPPSFEASNVQTDADSDTREAPSGPEIAHPTPRGHRHNVSETLQKGVEQAEYHLEDSIRRQLEKDDRNQLDDDLMKSRWAVADAPLADASSNAQGTILPQQHLFREHNDIDREDEKQEDEGLPLDGSDIDTNPSRSGSFHDQFSSKNMFDSSAAAFHQAQRSVRSFKPRHKSRTSVSTLNVEAKEFDPSSSFASNTFSFTGNSFQPPPPSNFQVSNPNSIFSPSLSQHSATSSSFNVAAPSFPPGRSNKGSISSNTNFNFSTVSFNIDAPVFNPGRSFASDTTSGRTHVSGSDAGIPAPAPAPTFPGGKIFSAFDTSSAIVKPAKRSKAIPIIRPDDNVSKKPAATDERRHGEDAAGRVGPVGREKRVRRAGGDGDGEVEFALPSNPLAESRDMGSLNGAVRGTNYCSSAGGKENVGPDESVKISAEKEVDAKDAAVPADIADTAAAVGNITPVSKDTPISHTTEWRPFEFENGSEAAVFSASFPAAPGLHLLETGNDSVIHDREQVQKQDQTVTQDNALVTANCAKSPTEKEPLVTADNEEAPDNPKAPSVLKPTAKAFEFKPTIPPVTPAPVPYESATQVQPVAPLKQARPSSVPKKSVGLEGSRYAVSTPPSSPPPAKYINNTVARSPAEAEDYIALEEEDTLPLSEVGAHSEEDAEHDSLNEEEIDAVMQQLNDENNSGLGIERFNTPQPEMEKSSGELFGGGPRLIPSYAIRSNAPSPSPQGSRPLFANVPKIDSAFGGPAHHILSPQRSSISDSNSPIRHLNNPEIEHVSDWDDAISVGEDAKLRQRSRFFDRHVNEIVGGIIEDRLDPLERTLGVIQQSIDIIAANQVLNQSHNQNTRRSASAGVEHSDADDEDDEEDDEALRYRSRSPLNRRGRHVNSIKQAVAEALASHVPRIEVPAPPPAPVVDLTEIHVALAELKTLAAPKPVEPVPEPPIDLKQVIIDAISEHPRLNAPVESVSHTDNIEALKMQVEGLQAMLRVADERAEKEYQIRRDAQDSVAQCQRLLRIAEEDAAYHRELVMKTEEAFRDLKERTIPETERIERQSRLLQEQQESLQLTLSELSGKNISLEETLDEYRVSADQWRSQLEMVKRENKDLKLTINHMKEQIEDSMAARQGLRKKFERLQDDMISASRDIARNQATWRKTEEDLIAKNNALRATCDREVKLREKLEMDISDLQQQEREATKLRFIFGQSQQENARLEELVMSLRQENHDLRNKATRLEREFNDTRESSHIEIKMARKVMEADLDAANNQVNYIRAGLESQISNLQNQLDNVRLDADTAKARHELQLEEATDAKKLALAEAAESKESALQEQRLLQERGLNDLRERHARALHNSSDDRQRSEAHLMELLSLRDEKISNMENKLSHVEEKLEIAKSAAQAAAQAAQKSNPAPILSPIQPTPPSMTYRRGSEIPEKISPQALRESIIVLQDQLQQREGRIEELEQELAEIDKDAPAKVKERETEINWLRELLGVRLDDLQDIINTLSQPTFNQQAVRDAAIRLKANVQMEQQEKERATSGSRQQFPSLSTLSNLAASHRSLPLAAAAAWGNWRKARENSSISNTSTNTNNQHTPSKGSNNPSSFLSGLLTPPSSNIRQSPATYSAPPAPMPMGASSRRTYSESRSLRSYNHPSSGIGPRRLSTRQREKIPQDLGPPSTPPLLHQSSYDHDAEATSYGEAAYGYDYGDDSDSILGEMISAQESGSSGVDGPFGPSI
ncbi:hypothetical protein GX48_06219 [Paracoccidioides brasiliensis]|nr:hypothetical protein GX48_06219 [Paracoccidioides brasiliensis]